jgi:DNA-binding SARP family transcriptional activator
LAAAHLQALELMVQADLALRRHEEAEYVARRIVGLEPLRESAYRLLVRALLAGGNRAQAQRVVAECRRVLRRDLGVLPSAETERCFSAVETEVRIG